ncbi:hypothetical protein AB0K18_38350 [Nonomuraea sp. NPDC049421]|uniref:hypothetical protein n=1 Tax=Nonomuraea sp. NPDC049421 TaxID=3155275 RepID=UPI00342A878E
MVISGTHGQIESRHGRTPNGTPLPGSGTFTFSPLFGAPETIDVIVREGGHEGAGPVLHNDLCGTPEPESLRLGPPADARQGALAVATGEAIRRSAVERRPIDIAALLSPDTSEETPASRRERNRTPAEQDRGSRFAVRRTGVETPCCTAGFGSVFDGGDDQATGRTIGNILAAGPAER